MEAKHIHSVWVVTTTCPDPEDADRIARAAVSQRLAACAQVDAAVASLYHWNGKVENALESRIVFKTPAEAVAELMAWLKSVHGYETPQIVAWPAMIADRDYARWVHSEVVADGMGPQRHENANE